MTIRKLLASTALLAGVLGASAAHAALALNPVSTAPAAIGDGLSATWVQVRDDYRFSQYQWHEPGEPGPAPISSFGWGTGIWATGDLAHVASLDASNPNVVARSEGKSGLNFANAVYNGHVSDGTYGDWSFDRVRPLAPVVESSGQQTNYAAFMTGYLYIPTEGMYDFGAFADDGFAFSLYGADGMRFGMERETLAGSLNGRDFQTMSGSNGDELLALEAGYYALTLEYFNRLEAGVFELMWWLPGSEMWSSISMDSLFTSLPTQPVPAPGTLALIALAVLLLGTVRKPRSHSAGGLAAI